MPKPTARGSIVAFSLSVLGVFFAVNEADAQLTSADVGLNPTNTQTGDNTITPTGAFFSARAFFTNSGDYTTGALTYPGVGSPQTLIDQGYTPDLEIGYSDESNSLSALQALYPAGNYVFDVTGSQPEATFTIPYATPAAYSNTPALTNFDALQGVNASQDITVDFNPFVPSENATSYEYFFEVTDNGAVVFSSSGDPASSVVIPGGTLSAGTTYDFDLDYSDRITTYYDAPNAQASIPLTQFYDTHTSGSFSTAVPEPSTWAMMALGFAALGFAGYRTSRQRSSVAA